MTSARRWLPSRRLRLVLAGCLLVALFINGVVLAAVVAEPKQHGASAAVHPQDAADSGIRLPGRAKLERDVLLVLVRSPSRLPAALVDPRTGLARNNLRVSCRHFRQARYICRVGAPGTARRVTLAVRYRNGRILEISAARIDPGGNVKEL